MNPSPMGHVFSHNLLHLASPQSNHHHAITKSQIYFAMSELREDFVASAVTFLKDPQVASAPLAKKIEFLESKELTNAEIQEALSRANGATSVTPPNYTQPQHQQAGAPPLPPYSYATYSQPPPLPKRDWRDYFIMATVSVGVTYGLYEIAKRYVLPMIMPPTPPALESDKLALEAEFARAQTLLDQLVADTEALKASETERAQKVDDALKEVDEVVKAVKDQVQQREDEMKLVKSQIENIKNDLPKALEKHGDVQKFSLNELQTELKSLKHLVSMRIKATEPVSAPSPVGTPVSAIPTSTTPTPAAASADGNASTPSAPNPVAPRSGIPAWQLAAGAK